MGFRYKGEHKGSTMKARGKNTLWAFFNAFLVVALVVGLMPGVSFAGDAVRVALQANDKPAEKASVGTASDSGSSKGDSGKKADSEKSDSGKSDSDKSDVAKGDSASSSSSSSSSSADEAAKAPKEDSATDDKDDSTSVTKVDSADKSDAKDETDSDKSSEKAKESNNKPAAQDDEDEPADEQKPATKPADEGSPSSTAAPEESDEAPANTPTETSATTDSDATETATDNTNATEDNENASDDEDDSSAANSESTDDDDEGNAGSKKSTTLADKIKDETNRSKVASIGVAAADTNETENFKVELVSPPEPKIVDTVSYYAPTDEDGKHELTFKVTFTDAEYGEQGKTVALIKNKLGEKTKDVEVSSPENNNTYSGTFTVSEEEARVATEVKVTETDSKNQSSEKRFGGEEGTFVIDSTAPSAVNVTWAVDTGDAENITGATSDGGTTVSYILGDGVTSISATATVTVKDYNLNIPSNALDSSAIGTKITIPNTVTDLTTSPEASWSVKEEATATDPAVYECQIKFTTSEGAELKQGTSFTPSLEITPVDYAGNPLASETKSGTMTIADVDKSAPEIKVAENENFIASGSTTYFKSEKDENGTEKSRTVTINVTEPHASDADPTGSIKPVGSTGQDSTETLRFSAKASGDDTNKQTAKIVFDKNSGTDENTVYVTKPGKYTLMVEDTDIVGNYGTYTATIVYDPDLPTIQVDYKDDGTDITKKMKLTSDTASSGSAYIAANQTVTISLADAIELDTENSAVTYAKTPKSGSQGTLDRSNIDSDGTATVTLNISNDSNEDKYDITIKAVDKAQNEATYTATFEVYTVEPTIDVSWDDGTDANPGVDVDGFNKFYKSRTATVTIVDRLFDKDAATAGLVVSDGGKAALDGDGKVQWTKGSNDDYVAVVKYGEVLGDDAANTKDANLKVSYQSKAGKKAVAATSSGVTVAEGVYTSDSFNILAKPVMNVKKPQTEPAQNTEDSDRWYYVLDEKGEAKFIVTVLDLDFDSNKDKVKLQATCEPGEAQTVGNWSSAGIFHTQTITYDKDCDVAGFKIETPGYVGSDGNPWADDGRLSAKTPLDDNGTYTHDPVDFAIDNTPPIVANLTFSEPPASTLEIDNQTVRYFGKNVNANLAVTEKHLATDGSKITVGLTKDGVEQATVPSPTRGSDADALQMLWNGIPLSTEKDKELTYVVSVKGTDLANKKLVLANTEGSEAVLTTTTDGFASTAVVDTRGPRLSVTYEGATIDGNAAYLNSSVTAKIVVEDLSLGNGSGIVVEDIVDGTAINTDKTPLRRDTTDLPKYRYTAEITISNVNDAMHTLKISGKDLAGNDMIAATDAELNVTNGVYQQDIQVETIPPELTVTMAPYTASTMPHTVIMEDGKVPTYYYNEKVKLDGSVTDNAHLTASKIAATVNSKPMSGATLDSENKRLENIFGASGFEIGTAEGATEDGEYTIQVTGADADTPGTDTAGNQMKAAEGATNRAADTGAMNNGVYKSKIVYDTKLPTVDVGYRQDTTSEYTDLAYNAEEVFGNKVYFEAIFSEPVDIEETTFEVKVGGVTRQVAPTWDTTASANEPRATFELNVENGDDQRFELSIDACDWAGNKLAGNSDNAGTATPYIATIDIDKKNPTVSVSYSPAYKTIRNAKTADEERYYNSDAVTATITVVENHFVPSSITVSAAGATIGAWESVGQQRTVEVTFTNEAAYSLVISGSDEVGNLLVSGDDATLVTTTETESTYKCAVIVDRTAPTVAVSYKREADANYAQLDYGTTKVSGEKLLFQAVFSEPILSGSTTFAVEVNGAKRSVSNFKWEAGVDADKPRATFELDVEANEDERFELSIDTCDRASNKLAGNPSTPGTATPYIATIDIDKLRPTISVAYSPAYKAIRDAKTADEKRYYNSDSVTATITVVENHFVPGNINVTAPNATVGTWKSDGYKRTIEVTFTREMAYSLTVIGADEVGNLLASGDDATFVTTTDEASTYACALIVDRTAPTVKVTYSESPTPGASDVELANGGKKQNANDLYAFVTITEALSFTHAAEDGSTFAITTTGAIQHTDDKIWKDNGDGTYTATILYQTGADTDKAFDLKVTGADLASNKLADYAAVIDIDKYCPRLSVSFDRTPGDITDLNTADETRYYNAANLPITVNVRIVEPNNPLDLSRITFTNAFSGATGTLTFTEEQDGTTYVYTASLTLDAPAADVVHTLNIYGADAVGNLLASVNMSDESPDGNDPMVAAGVYVSKVSLDVTQPHLSVEWDNAHAKNGKYFKEDRAATVKITETNFRPDRVSVKQNDTELNGGTWTEAAKGSRWTSGSGSNQKTWTRTGDNVWTFSVKPSYTDPTLTTKNNSQSVDASKDFDQHLTVTAVDRALNDLSSTVDDNATPASDQAPTCAGGVYTSAGFVIDEYAPEAYVLISREKKWTSDDGKIDYFNGSLVATLYIKDIHYGVGHEESTAPVVNFGAGKERSGWSASNHEGQLWWYRMAFGQNEQGADPHMIDATICDYAGNKVVYRYGQSGQKSGTYYGDEQDNAKRLTGTSGFYVDTTAPDVKPFSGREDIPTHHYSGKYGSNKGAILFTKDATSMNIRVTDNIGLFKIDLVEKSDGKDEPANYSYSTDDEKSGFKHGDKSHNITIKLKEETTHGAGEFNGHLVLRCEDAAKNKCYWSINTATGSMVDVTPLYGNEGTLYPEKFIQDTVAPVLTFSGSVPASGAENARYYNSEQSVTLDVDEASFYWLKRYDASQEIMNIAKRSGDASLSSSRESVSVGDFNKVTEDKYTYTKQFATDGHYTIDAHLTDPAGNVAQEKRIEEFTIDRTDPTIQVTWDNNDARNGNYYKAGRTATLVVTEHNFDASRITITTSGSIGGWSSNGDTHTCTVACTSDGRYALQVSGTDKAGNQLAPYNEPEFVVDMIAPTISFSQVEDQTAYNDNIAPVIVYEDEANFNSGAMEYTLTGAKYGTQSMAASQGSSGNSGTVTYADFDREVESDDIWTLDAHVADMAGNEADNHIMFSVNRFGSNFMIEDADDYAEGYLDEAREVRVREVNVSGVSSENHGVTVTHGLTTENLERQSGSGGSSATGYYIDEGSESTGWSAYTYHIGAGNFPDDGNYHVVVNSTDVATNLNNSANYYDPALHENADAEVSFILDTVAPIIDSLSILPGGTYDAGQKNVTFNVIDNIGCDDVAVTLDGERLPASDVALDASGLCMVNVPAVAFKARDMEIVATDRAGHTAEESVLGFHMTTNPLELHMPVVAGGAIVVAAAAVGGVLFVRRRRL